jgi:hypothetical protein
VDNACRNALPERSEQQKTTGLFCQINSRSTNYAAQKRGLPQKKHLAGIVSLQGIEITGS